MKMTQPMLEDRNEQPYMGIRTEASLTELDQVVPVLLAEVFAWLGKQGMTPAGPPFIRYYVINMAANMAVEVGVPVASDLEDDGKVCPGMLPAGRYAALIYTGTQNGVEGNGGLDRLGERAGHCLGCLGCRGSHAVPQPVKVGGRCALMLYRGVFRLQVQDANHSTVSS